METSDALAAWMDGGVLVGGGRLLLRRHGLVAVDSVSAGGAAMKRFWQVWQDTWMLLWALVCFLFPYALFFWACYLLKSGEWRGFFDSSCMGC
jgi:hypothetical protein